MARILIIDDDTDFLKLLGTFFVNAGHEVELVSESAKAIEAIEQFKPDVVILDIIMPGLSGGSVYQGIREKIGAELPVIVVSGTSLRLSSAGTEEDPHLAHCSKPLDFDHLMKVAQKFFPAAATDNH